MFSQRFIASLALCAVVTLSLPLPSLAVSAPSAQAILKQSFANLENAASYDVNGSLGIVLPKSMRPQIANDDLVPYLVGGKEIRGYFNGTFDKKTETYQFTATSYNVQTGESPRVDVVGNKKGVVNFRVDGFALSAPTSPEIAMLQRYVKTWIRIDPTDFPAEVSPLLRPIVDSNQIVNYPAEPSTNVSSLSAEEKKKVEELSAKIKKAFWARNVLVARRLADAKDHTGAAAYRLGLKFNSFGARLFALDVAKIIGTKPSASDLKELNKIFTQLPVLSADVIVNKKTMLPELLTLSVSGFEKKAVDDFKVAFRISFENVGSGREVVMPANYIPVQKIIDQVTNATTSSVANANCMMNGTCPMVADPQPCVIYGGCVNQ